MFLKERQTGHMVEIIDLNGLFDLFHDEVQGCYQFGEEAQDPENFSKQDLLFLSGEELPGCWTDPGYRGNVRKR